jgi:signal peptidase I
MSFEAPSELNPFVSVWLRPRKTIEHIVATQPTRWVLVLTAIGGMSAQLTQLIAYRISDWRIVLIGAVGGAAFGVLNLWIASYVIAWLGRMMRGRGSAQAVRAALAWGQLPIIAGVIAMAVLVGAAEAIAANPVVSRLLLAAASSVAAAGVVWLLVVQLLMISRVEQFGFWRTITVYVLGGIVGLLHIPLVVRTFLFQPFNVPAGSMAPTLRVGDYFFANKFAYGYSQFSLPFGPWGFSGRLFASDPQRGEVVVLALPKQPSITYVKRVIGLGGDRLTMKDGLLFINGAAVQRERLSDVVGDFCGSDPSFVAVKRWRETLPNGTSYETLDCVDNGFYDNTPEYVVPAGYAFVMGDNRDNSTDSRVLSTIGYIPLDHIFGRVSMIFYSRGAGPHGEAVVRNERIGTLVR